MTAKAASPRIFDTRAISFWRGVGSSSVLSSMPAMQPIWVPMPVEVTTIRPVPWVTAVPLRTMLVLSPKATVRSSRVGRLPTGRDSPATRRTKVWGGGERDSSPPAEGCDHSTTQATRDMAVAARRRQTGGSLNCWRNLH